MLFRIFVLSLASVVAWGAEAPVAEIGNGKIRMRVYLPDAENGYYKGTRFDWSGVIAHLEAEGHTFYGPWFTKRNPAVRDFVYEGEDIVAGACSATMGPADEFGPVGYDEAAPGAAFIKIGVGALRRPDDARYDGYRLYEVADGGKWTVNKRADAIEFTQALSDAGSGYGYVYRKTLRLVKGNSEMVMEHSLKNTGRKRIETSVYNHNFLVLDGKGPGPGAVITTPFPIQTSRPPKGELAEIVGNQVIYKKALAGRDVVSFPVTGFDGSAANHKFRIENRELKAGMSVQGDRPLEKVNLWSIRSNISMEPFVAVAVGPGEEFRWSSTYRYYGLR
jgi:hypothetical protein